MTVKTSISLTDQQDDFARSLVREGRFSSLSSVVQQGLDLLRDKTEAKNLETEALRFLLRERQSGDFVSSSDMAQRIKKMAAQKAKNIAS
ncbi:MAG: type II toxin-antitoxin system ParD family antitoxin [Robiginitomaculum sp.]|nr:MAG: type II toxin-antitoxin system ParD family antitoxin [Robiginitomaculum sp.]